MTTLSTHVLDTERGAPAIGVSIALYQGDRQIGQGLTNADGRIADLAGRSLEPGVYRLEFAVAAYFADEGRAAPFLQRVVVEFQTNASDPHYHVPLLLSRYACTTYRGS
jgi:5-hydroxyisourate hydrolase